MVCSKTENSPGDARGNPIEAEHLGDLRNLVCGHRVRVLREGEAKRPGEGTKSKSGT